MSKIKKKRITTKEKVNLAEQAPASRLAIVYEKYMTSDMSELFEKITAIQVQLQEDIETFKVDPKHKFQKTGLTPIEWSVIKLLTSKDTALNTEFVIRATRYLHEYQVFQKEREKIEAKQKELEALKSVKKKPKKTWDDKALREGYVKNIQKNLDGPRDK